MVVRPAAAGPGRGPARSRSSFASKPLSGSATYGNAVAERLVVLVDAVAERDLLAALLGLAAARRRSRAARCRSRRRPAGGRSGSPAVSPASTPKRFGVAVGGHAEVELQRVGAARRCGAIWVRPGTPVSSAWTMSVRLFSLTPRLNSAFRIARRLRVQRVLRRSSSASSAGDVALNLSFWPIGMITSLISGLPRRLTCTQRVDRACAVAAATEIALALGGRPHADDGVGGLRRRRPACRRA